MAKRIVDVVVSLLALLLLTPLMLMLAVAVAALLGRPVFFVQQRPGLNGRPFKMFKFRSMRYACDNSGAPLPDSERLTSFGRLLRKTSLDELPELWNVLRGDMSLVGPRPLLLEYLPLYTAEQMRRHEVPPGVTGWAQVKGRDRLSWEDKFALDVWYVDHRSMWLDFKIMAMTAIAVLRVNETSQQGHATVEKFRG